MLTGQDFKTPSR